MIARRLAERVRDVALVLFECGRYDQALGRLQLQKLIYLLDSLSVCRLLLTPEETHEVYLNGPYDAKIQDAADVLVFRGLARAYDIEVRTNGHLACKYALTAEGNSWVSGWQHALQSFSDRAELVRELVDALQYRHAFPRLKDLVYAEPTYSALKQRGNGYLIHLQTMEDNLSAQVLALAERSFSKEAVPVTSRFLVEIFLEFLESRSALV